MKVGRRAFIKIGMATISMFCNFRNLFGDSRGESVRKYNVSVTIEALERYPELVDIFAEAGVSEVWLGGFLYGHWYFTPEAIAEWKKRIENVGVSVSVINVPLGHPGDSLGSYSGQVPLTPPKHWSVAVNYLGKQFVGTSLHSPACEENVEAIRRLRGIGISRVFLDDDFRLAPSPGLIGGCFCEEHKRKFLDLYGYSESSWDELLDAVANRRYNKLLKDWVDFNCNLLTRCFREMEKCCEDVRLGIMVMYMGSEKAGIRLGDYKNNLFRVGEGMFNDDSFRSVKNKCNELFSVLFHRRFVSPENAYSETTAFPADRLSAKNMSAKLVISTIADVRNTMYMSGVQHFPKAHWEVLPVQMKKQAEFHDQIAGHKLVGPLKHYWGERSRYVSDDNPYSLFLAMGVPFEVVDEIEGDGWSFVSEYDLEGVRDEVIARCVSRHKYKDAICVPEDLDSLFRFKREIVGGFRNIPYIVEEKPVVCAWYPSARKVLVWNLSEGSERLTLRRDEKTFSVELDGLESALVDDMAG